MSSSPSRAPVMPAIEKVAGGESGAASPFPYSHAVAAPGQRNFPLAGPMESGGGGRGESLTLRLRHPGERNARRS